MLIRLLGTAARSVTSQAIYSRCVIGVTAGRHREENDMDYYKQVESEIVKSMNGMVSASNEALTEIAGAIDLCIALMAMEQYADAKDGMIELSKRIREGIGNA